MEEELEVLTKSGFVRQHLENADGADFAKRIEYKGYWVWAEYPNGGMTAISIMHIWLKQMFSFPCGIEEVEPFFDYHESDKAIEWAKSVIDQAVPFWQE
ncbi:MAG: hypothetical protein ACRC78_02715 [Planktothrix sp.]